MAERGLTEREAYEAMLAFLDAYWKRGQKRSDELATLLGSAAMNSDGAPLDPALWSDWVNAVETVRREKQSR